SFDAYENKIARPIRRQNTREGYDYIQKFFKNDHVHFWQFNRMYPENTNRVGELTTYLWKMVATFFMTVGQNSRYCHTIDTFKRSKFTATTDFHKVFKALSTLAPSLMAKPDYLVSAKISKSTRFYHYFKIIYYEPQKPK
ncbi:unnamed protein product, partial [Thlaspi arvense]